jgi:hypothetical protein
MDRRCTRKEVLTDDLSASAGGSGSIGTRALAGVVAMAMRVRALR